MTQQPVEPSPATSAEPFNRRLLAQGRALPPGGAQRAYARRHFVTQERIGWCLAAAALYGVVYGARLVFANGAPGAARGDFLTPLYVVLGAAAALALASLRARRRPPRVRRKVRYPAAL